MTNPATDAMVPLEAGCSLIAEGIETEAERTALRSLAVSLGQGYLLGRPAPLPN
jgi:EAL domain-containing protein (putative c-di-GMP-specific phosphodiesterase class I)